MTSHARVAPAGATIRAARPEEATQLSELAIRSKAHWGYDAAFMASCRAELTVELGGGQVDATFVIEAQERVLGFYAVAEAASDCMELEFLFVEPTAIGRGYGRALIEHAKRYVREHGYRVLVIQGDPHATAFYRAAGALQVGERASASLPGRMLPLLEIDVGKLEL